jgi:Putative Actinobacterial Holin-X, holin superfamily III
MNNKDVYKDPATPRESFTDLLGKLASESATVIHDEIELVVQGVRENVRVLYRGVVLVVTGAAIGFAAFMSFCAALFIELTSYMAPVIAALVIGAVLALIGVVIVFIGYRQLKK